MFIYIMSKLMIKSRNTELDKIAPTIASTQKNKKFISDLTTAATLHMYGAPVINPNDFALSGLTNPTLSKFQLPFNNQNNYIPINPIMNYPKNPIMNYPKNPIMNYPKNPIMNPYSAQNLGNDFTGIRDTLINETQTDDKKIIALNEKFKALNENINNTLRADQTQLPTIEYNLKELKRVIDDIGVKSPHIKKLIDDNYIFLDNLVKKYEKIRLIPKSESDANKKYDVQNQILNSIQGMSQNGTTQGKSKNNTSHVENYVKNAVDSNNNTNENEIKPTQRAPFSFPDWEPKKKNSSLEPYLVFVNNAMESKDKLSVHYKDDIDLLFMKAIDAMDIKEKNKRPLTTNDIKYLKNITSIWELSQDKKYTIEKELFEKTLKDIEQKNKDVEQIQNNMATAEEPIFEGSNLNNTVVATKKAAAKPSDNNFENVANAVSKLSTSTDTTDTLYTPNTLYTSDTDTDKPNNTTNDKQQLHLIEIMTGNVLPFSMSSVKKYIQTYDTDNNNKKNWDDLYNGLNSFAYITKFTSDHDERNMLINMLKDMYNIDAEKLDFKLNKASYKTYKDNLFGLVSELKTIPTNIPKGKGIYGGGLDVVKDYTQMGELWMVCGQAYSILAQNKNPDEDNIIFRNLREALGQFQEKKNAFNNIIELIIKVLEYATMNYNHNEKIKADLQWKYIVMGLLTALLSVINAANVATSINNISAPKIEGSSIYNQTTFTRTTKNNLMEYGNDKILSVQLCKKNIPNHINYLYSKILPYDQLYHLFAIITVNHNGILKNLILEKQSFINLSDNYNIEGSTQIMNLPEPFNVNLIQALKHMNLLMGSRFFTYNAFNNNCQVFIRHFAAVLGKLTKEADSFIYQDKIIDQPVNGIIKHISNGITDIHGFVKGTVLGGDIEQNNELMKKPKAKKPKAKKSKKNKKNKKNKNLEGEGIIEDVSEIIKNLGNKAGRYLERAYLGDNYFF